MQQKKPLTEAQLRAQRKYNAKRPPKITVSLASDDQLKRLDELRGSESKNSFILRKIFE